MLQRRFSNIKVMDTEICPCIEAGAGEGGNNLPIILESTQNHATITDKGICPTLTASMGLGGGYVPMVAYGFDPGASRDVGILFLPETSKTLSNGTCPGHHNGVVIVGEGDANGVCDVGTSSK